MARISERQKRLREAHADWLAFKAGKPNNVKIYTVTVPEAINVKKVRRKLGMSQAEFSARYGFKAATVRDWEQGRRKPDRAARILLTVIDKEPEVIERALASV